MFKILIRRSAYSRPTGDIMLSGNVWHGMGDTKRGRERKGRDKRAQRIAEDVDRAMAVDGNEDADEWFEPREDTLDVDATSEEIDGN